MSKYSDKKKYKPTIPKYEYVVEENTDMSIDEYLKTKYMYSSKVITQVKKFGKLTLNDEEVFFIERCKSADRIVVTMQGEMPDNDGYDISIDIIYEDEDILVVNKQANLVVHPTKSHLEITLAAGIYNHFNKINHIGKIRFVNRLDMDTSGIVLCAKNKYVHHFIQNQFQSSGVEKSYLALVCGCPELDHDIIDAPIARQEDYSMFRVVREDGQRAITEYDVIKKYKNYSLVRLKLHTGRTHQIRVHMKHIGCPIVGDNLYCEDKSIIQRQALHAQKLSFIHPRNLEVVSFEAPIPEDFLKAIKSAENQNIIN